jgi:predicted DNA-binding transcriptional regulator AlpA
MPSTQPSSTLRFSDIGTTQRTSLGRLDPLDRKPPTGTSRGDSLLTVEDVARRLNVSKDWVWDHSSRKKPRLPVIRMGDGALRYRANAIEAFIDERERLSALRLGNR